MRTTRVALGLAALLSLAACGGGGDDGGGDKDAAGEDGGPTTTALAAADTDGYGIDGIEPGAGSGGAPGTPNAPGAGPTSSVAPGPAGAGGATTTTAASKPPLEMSAELATACVRPGGTQTITIHAPPETPVGYGAEYADGKTSMDPGYYGGAGAGKTTAAGPYQATWTVAVNAPKGPVKVRAFGANPNYRLAERTVTFQVADATGKCS